MNFTNTITKFRFLLISIIYLFPQLSFSQAIKWQQEVGMWRSDITCMTYNGLAIFAGTAENGIIRSTDDGETWEKANTGLTQERINDVESIGTSVFAATQEGIFRSTNNGVTWQFNAFKEGSIQDLVADGTALYLGGRFIYRTDDQGDSWQTIYDTHSNTSRIYASGKNIFASFGSFGNKFIKSSDYGITWESVKIDEFNYILVIRQNKSDIFVGNESGVFHSPDNGTTWKKTNLNKEVRKMIIVDNWIFVSGIEGAFKSNDNGDKWTKMDITFSCALQIDKTIYFYGSDYYNNALFTTTDYGETFSKVNCYQSIFCFLQQPNRFCIGTDYGYFSIERDGNGRIVHFHEANPTGSFLFAGKVKCLEADDTLMFIGTNVGLYRYNDQGDYKYPLVTGGGYFHALSSNEKHVFVGNDYGALRMSKATKLWEDMTPLGNINKPIHIISIHNNFIAMGSDNGVFISTDAGDTWNQKNNGLTNIKIQALFIENNIIIAGTSTGVFISDDLGEYWRLSTTGLTNTNVHCVYKIPNMLLAGTDAGVFHSTNKGLTWEQNPTDLTKSVVTAFQHIDKSIFGEGVTIEVGTLMQGSFYIDNYDDITSIDKLPIESDSIRIFPNPARDHITVDLGKKRIDSRMELYDLQGLCIGKYNIGILGWSSFRTDDLSSAPYTMRVMYDNTIITKPIAIIK
jgi:photosystem II stability/assembly factor-like uncharacterized protein